MAFVIFTLTLVPNYYVHLISVADELGGLGWRWHSACAKYQSEKWIPRCTDAHHEEWIPRWTDAHLFCPEDLVWPVCQHGCLLASGTAMTHTPTAAVCTHTFAACRTQLEADCCHISQCYKTFIGRYDEWLQECGWFQRWQYFFFLLLTIQYEISLLGMQIKC